MIEKSPQPQLSPDALQETAGHLIEIAQKDPDNPVARQDNQQIIKELIDDRIKNPKN